MQNKKLILPIISAVMALFLGGCFMQPADDLYALPQQPQGFYDLQAAINTVLVNGTQYSSPVSGTNQQPVQMVDIDGDGVDEALVFAKSPGMKPLKVFIFQKQPEGYKNICVIEGDGSAFNRVDYVQLDGKDGLDIVIGRQVGNQALQVLGAYSICNGTPIELVNANYSEYTIADLDADGSKDIFLTRFDAESNAQLASLYRYTGSGMEREPEIVLTSTPDCTRHIKVGNLTEENAAVFVSGVAEDTEIITDVFFIRTGAFSSFSSKGDLHLKAFSDRGYNVFPTDVDDDGIVELPDLISLLPYSSLEPDDAYFAIRWFNADVNGTAVQKDFTFHNYASGWFIQIPQSIGTNFTVGRDHEVGGVKGLCFAKTKPDGGHYGDIFTVYAFTGNDRNNLASLDGRFAVGTKGESVFSVQLGEAAREFDITEENFTELFHFIRVDWNSDET